MEVDVEDFLEHHGIKGMKWGVRSKGPAPKTSSDHKKAVELKAKGVAGSPKASSLTNKQLKMFNERAQLEQKFNQMTPGTIKRGENHVKAILGTLTLAASVYTLAKSPAGQALIKRGKVFVEAGKAANAAQKVVKVASVAATAAPRASGLIIP